MTTETIDNLKGFPSAGLQYSQNMIPSDMGLDAYLRLNQIAVSGSPGRFNWFTEFNGGQPWAVDTTGKLFSNDGGGWNLRRSPTSSLGNGLITDQKGRLLYARNQWLGMATEGGGPTYTDDWKDFGASLLDFRPMDTYEDWVIAGNGNKLAVLNTTDDSWNTAGFTLPSGFTVRAVKSNRTGILIAANYQNRGIAFLWDARTLRSISDWIWFDHKIQSVCKAGDGWIITTMKEQWLTNGYSLVRKLLPYPDTLLHSENFRCIPAGTLYTDGRLLTLNTDVGAFYTRHKSGLYVLDLANERYSLALPHHGVSAEITLGAVFQNSTSQTFVSYSTTLPSGSFLAELKNDIPTRAVAVIGPFGAGPEKKVAQAVSLEWSIVPTAQLLYQNTAELASADVSVKVYNFRRQLWAYGQTNNASAAGDILHVGGNSASINNAAVGDEVTILSGVNAGEIRHIAAIANRNTATEQWTLDSALPNNTESSVLFNVQPYQLVRKQTLTADNYADLDDLLFDVKNRIKGRKFLVKIVVENIVSLPLSLQSVSLTHDKQGVNKPE